MSHIGHIEDFADNSTTTVEAQGISLLVVRRWGEVFLYENRCPHINEHLDPMGGSVCTPDGQLLVCQHHGAEFLLDSGECVGGPCLGQSLRALPFTLGNGEIYLD